MRETEARTVTGVLEAARRLAAEFAAGAAERDRERRFPHEELAQLKESGLLALMIPTEDGGLGGTAVDGVRAVGALAEGDPNIAQIYSTHCGGTEMVGMGAAPHVRSALNAAVVEGRLLWTNAYSEVGTKTAADYRVKLSRTGSGWSLNGEKFYCTGSLGGEWMFVTAVVEGDDDGDAPNVCLALLPTDAPGVTIVDDWSGMGQRTTASGTITFDNVAVDADHVIPTTFFSSSDGVLGVFAQAVFSAIYVGIAKNALTDAVTYVQVKARPWMHSGVARAAEDPYIMLRLAQMQVLVDAADALQERALDAIARLESDPSPETRGIAAVEVAKAKTFSTEYGLKVCEMLFQVCGASGTLARHGFDRHWRNLRTLTLHDPADYKLRLIGDYVGNGRLPVPSDYT